MGERVKAGDGGLSDDAPGSKKRKLNPKDINGLLFSKPKGKKSDTTSTSNNSMRRQLERAQQIQQENGSSMHQIQGDDARNNAELTSISSNKTKSKRRDSGASSSESSHDEESQSDSE